MDGSVLGETTALWGARTTQTTVTTTGSRWVLMRTLPLGLIPTPSLWRFLPSIAPSPSLCDLLAGWCQWTFMIRFPWCRISLCRNSVDYWLDTSRLQFGLPCHRVFRFLYWIHSQWIFWRDRIVLHMVKFALLLPFSSSYAHTDSIQCQSNRGRNDSCHLAYNQGDPSFLLHAMHMSCVSYDKWKCVHA